MRKYSVDLNLDMGEGFGLWMIGDGVDEQIMLFISLVNIVIGFYVGDLNIMVCMVQFVCDVGVGIGVYLGFCDLVGFGCCMIIEMLQVFVYDILYQFGVLCEFVWFNGVSLQYVKLYGVFYMYVVVNEVFLWLLIEMLQCVDFGLWLYCMEVLVMYCVVWEYEQLVICEFYVDCDYDCSGFIVFMCCVGCFDLQQVVDKVLCVCIDGKVCMIDGDDIDIDFDLVCIYSDMFGVFEFVCEMCDVLVCEGIWIVGL